MHLVCSNKRCKSAHFIVHVADNGAITYLCVSCSTAHKLSTKLEEVIDPDLQPSMFPHPEDLKESRERGGAE